MARQIITQPCCLEGCDRVLTYEYKGYGRKRRYCSTACSKAAKKAQDGSRDRHGERERTRANRAARRNRNALRGITDYEIDEGWLTVRGRPTDLQKGPLGPTDEGQTVEGGHVTRVPDRKLSDHEWFKANPDWDKDL